MLNSPKSPTREGETTITFAVPKSLRQKLKVVAAQKGITVKVLLQGYCALGLNEDDPPS
jgi:hypothetical protein